MTQLRNTLLLFAVLLMASCGASLPDDYSETGTEAPIYPDCRGVTIPVNIAPLTFELLDGADDAVVSYSCGSEKIVLGGMKAQPDEDEWRSLTASVRAGAITVDVYSERDGQWSHYQPFKIYVSPDSIDPYISYRLISPSYVSYEELTINQRCLENYDESVIYDNMLLSTEEEGQCINCHSYQNYNPRRMQFHARQHHGGTFISYDGHSEKVQMRGDSLLSAGVYPAWHPRLPLIAYSTNKTVQSFHTRDINKIEVFDGASDLILYDIMNHRVLPVASDKREFETYPAWSPDGKYLYYCSAHFEYPADTMNIALALQHAREIRYNIYRMPFDERTLSFGPRELVFDAAAMKQSATLPRISPDGRRLLFAMASYGCFHIWHHDADLWMMDLQTMKAQPLTAANSPDTESYHTWSSNGRWIVFSSRRTDGDYTRPFIAHIDAHGHAAKAFELPQQDPDYHRQLMKSYNLPEFMRGPVTLTPQEIARVMGEEK